MTTHKLTKLPGLVSVKPEFESRYRELLGDQYNNFMQYSLSYINKSVRINTLKVSAEMVKGRLREQGFSLRKIPWCDVGYWVSGPRTDFGNLKEHFLGYIYVQEAASMLPAQVLGPRPCEFVLDMCASPGSKTTQICAAMENTGLIIANDIRGIRMKPLGLNLQRCGAMNVLQTIMRGQQFAKLSMVFDKILVDAPCSGTGTIRRNPETLKIWNPGMITRLSRTQKTLIEAAFSVLKKSGTMVYSTCSVEPEENESVIDFLLRKYPNAQLEEICVEISKSNPVMKFGKETYDGEIGKCLRIWPQDNNTEGFFVAKIRKL